MKNLDSTKTQANLISAFAGEAQAHMKYTFFAKKAEKDGFNEIASIFEETAKNEQAHARLWYKYLHSNEMPSTAANLTESIDGEYFEHTNMYPEYAETARQEGFTEIARLFELVGEIEAQHEARFKKLLTDVQGATVFSKDGDAVWICMNCGNIVVGKSAPQVCPVCKKPQAYYKVKQNG